MTNSWAAADAVLSRGVHGRGAGEAEEPQLQTPGCHHGPLRLGAGTRAEVGGELVGAVRQAGMRGGQSLLTAIASLVPVYLRAFSRFRAGLPPTRLYVRSLFVALKLPRGGASLARPVNGQYQPLGQLPAVSTMPPATVKAWTRGGTQLKFYSSLNRSSKVNTFSPSWLDGSFSGMAGQAIPLGQGAVPAIRVFAGVAWREFPCAWPGQGHGYIAPGIPRLQPLRGRSYSGNPVRR